MLKIGINGYGRIGRCLHRQILKEQNLQITAINNRSPIIPSMLKYDSIHGRLDENITLENGCFLIKNQKIRLYQETSPENITWRDLDVIVDSSGKFKTQYDLRSHLRAAHNVILTCPPNDLMPIYLPRISQQLPNSQIFSITSCTTNALAPIIKLLDEKYNIQLLHCTTIHACTSSENLLDGSNDNPRKARSALNSIRESSTGASASIIHAFPKLQGKIFVKAYRVPVNNGSVLDIAVTLEKPVSILELKETLSCHDLGDILKITNDPIVSTDVIGEKCSSLIDIDSIKQMDEKFYTMTAYYDNEWGYTARIVDTLKQIHQL